MLRLRAWGLKAAGWYGRHLIAATVLYLVTVVLVAGAVYGAVEGSDITFVDGLWWAVVTLTTVGYGDISPSGVGLRVLAVWVMASGIISVALLTGWVAAKLAVAAIHHGDETPGIDDDFTALSADLADAAIRVQHLQDRFRLDERGDDRVSAAARAVVAQLGDGSGRVDAAALSRLRAAIERQELTDA